jgi:diamine N-acetyltransferase
MKTEEIKLVLIGNRHAKTRYEALCHPVVAAGIFIDIPISFEKTLEWCKTVADCPNRYDFCLELDGEAVGFCGLVNVNAKNGTCELYLFLHPSFFGRGFGSKCLRCVLDFAKYELNLRKITLYVTGKNEKALSLYKKFGFVKEGCLVDHVWFRGQYRNRYILSVFLDTFEENPEVFYWNNI